MAQPRSPERAKWPRGLYAPREGYFVYRSPISKRNIALGKISEREAIGYGKRTAPLSPANPAGQ